MINKYTFFIISIYPRTKYFGMINITMMYNNIWYRIIS